MTNESPAITSVPRLTSALNTMSYVPQVSDENVTSVLDSLNEITLALGDSTDISEDDVKARLQASLPASLMSSLGPARASFFGSFKRVNAVFVNGTVTIKTFITGYKNFEGKCNKADWGGSSGGWLYVSDGAGQADFVATNRAENLPRKGALHITFNHGSSKVGSFSGAPLPFTDAITTSATGDGTFTL
ncbi:hypothetical protein PHLGIDRAFT_150866 [Phlebiopsis gigantea 11061_1 CR5-6]|uniref:Uncharacterized protein n=1 Tax=Phlebiopsis gigantea (strain 11061_1 CR5-6) TaxID=745531 RepID=A0A0C3RVQ9_PHLG1|nr:hypothetical protein PHLGIDRAFT_150866 [Phlebiopsis gigantea 11061_1 CR5-6]